MFTYAKPVFLKNLKNEMNVTAFFCANFEYDEGIARLEVTGATKYKVTVNGGFICAGPAKAPHGYCKFDSIDITNFVTPGINQIVIEVASYNVHCYDGISSPGFIWAEVQADGKCVAATGNNFIGFLDMERVQKCSRYSFQRHFSEVYVIGGSTMIQTELEVIDTGLIPIKRDVSYPVYPFAEPKKILHRGKFKAVDKEIRLTHAEGDVEKGIADGFKQNELEYNPRHYLAKAEYSDIKKLNSTVKYPVALKKGEFVTFEFDINTVGFIKSAFKTKGKSRVMFGFSEKLDNNNFISGENGITNIIDFHLVTDGGFEREAFEPSGFKYITVFVDEGEAEICDLCVRQMLSPTDKAPKIKCNNTNIKKIYKAALQSYRCNSIDEFYDCPTRERAGWLCDSSMSAKTEFFLTGENTLEKSFLNSFVLGKNIYSKTLPEGMTPMSYPSDVLDRKGNFIPQWAMHYILEIYDFLKRNPKEKAIKFKGIVYDILKGFSNFENKDGLLENLPGWNFVEWSEANKWTAGVNYPTNMLYSKALECAGLLYSDKKLTDKAESIRKTVTEKSFDGKFFTDDENGNQSQVCQLYAIKYMNIELNDEKYSAIKSFVLKNEIPESFEPLNLFFGIYLKLDILAELKEYKKLLETIEKVFAPMANETGTLWEHKTAKNSLNHGFASCVMVHIYNALKEING